jgi:AcrR family transcriptional regulator
MPASVIIRVSPKLSIRDPLETDLGKKIVAEGIKMIDKMGYDAFTFKKLAAQISSTEASVYRYFRCKHQFLNYLVSWYWHWVDYTISVRTTNLTDKKKRLEVAIIVMVESDREDPVIDHIDEGALYKVVLKEGARIYLTRSNDGIPAKDVFSGYDLLFEKILKMVIAINPKYKHPRSLTRALIGLAHKQAFDTEFLEGTSAKVLHKGDERKKESKEFLYQLAISQLEPGSKR